MRIRRLSPFAVAALAVSTGLAAPALAPPTARARGGRWASHAAAGSVGTLATPLSSPGFAGYQWAASSNNDAAGVTASFVVPQVKNCTQTDTAIVPGVSVEDVHTETFSEAGLFVGCSGAKARYFPVLAINSNSGSEFKSLMAKPGDAIEVTVAENENVTRVSLKDKTRKTASKALTGAGTAATDATDLPSIGDLAWPFVFNPHWPVPDFGKISFSGAEIDGLALGAYGSQLNEYDLYDSTFTTLEVSTSGIASNGQSFKTTFGNP